VLLFSIHGVHLSASGICLSGSQNIYNFVVWALILLTDGFNSGYWERRHIKKVRAMSSLRKTSFLKDGYSGKMTARSWIWHLLCVAGPLTTWRVSSVMLASFLQWGSEVTVWLSGSWGSEEEVDSTGTGERAKAIPWPVARILASSLSPDSQ
jgi:hypothetical protein